MEKSEGKRVVAIVGRPNVGKSALFNRLVRRRVSIIHEEVGVTRDRLAGEANWNGGRFELIDIGDDRYQPMNLRSAIIKDFMREKQRGQAVAF